MGDDVSREPSELVAVRCALGHQLAALRQAAELGQQQVAHKTGYSRSSVAHAESGRQLLTRNFWKTADELVKADGALLAGYKRVQAAKQEHECQSREAELAAARARAQALHAAEYTRSIGSAPGATVLSSLLASLNGDLGPLLHLAHLAGEDGEDMIKRRLLLQAVLTGLGVGSTAAALEVVRHELNHVTVAERSAADVAEWQEIAWDYGQAYLVTAPATLLQALIVDLHGLQLAIHRHPGETDQRQLWQAGALLAAFTAQTAANLGNLVAARRWWRTARRIADEAGDSYIMFWIRGREVVRAGYEHRPVSVILQLANQAEARLDEAPPEVLPELLSGKAQTLALAGRPAEAEQALCQVRECFGKLPTAGYYRDSLFDWSEENLRFTESFIYSHLGDFTKSEQAQNAALRLYPDSNRRGPAQIELQRALCLARNGDLAHGTRHAQTIITDLPVMHRIRPIADLGQKVLDAIPAHERRQSWAQEYRECLESSFPPDRPTY